MTAMIMIIGPWHSTHVVWGVKKLQLIRRSPFTGNVTFHSTDQPASQSVTLWAITLPGHALRAPLAATFTSSPSTSFAHWYLLVPGDNTTSCVKRCHCPPPAEATTATTAAAAAAAHFHVACCWLLFAVCPSGWMVAMAPFANFRVEHSFSCIRKPVSPLVCQRCILNFG